MRGIKEVLGGSERQQHGAVCSKEVLTWTGVGADIWSPCLPLTRSMHSPIAAGKHSSFQLTTYHIAPQQQQH